MLVSNAGQDISFALLDIDFQQVNLRDSLLVDDLREGTQAAGKGRLLEQEAEIPVRYLRRKTTVDHVGLRGAAIGFQIGPESGHNSVAGVEGELRRTRFAGQAALKDARIDSMELDVGSQARAYGWTGFEGKDADMLAFLMEKHSR